MKSYWTQILRTNRLSLNDTFLEDVTECKYLGILFCENDSFYSTKTHIANQETKAMYSLLSKARNLQLPVDIQIELFGKRVKPILLYGCEVWGFRNLDTVGHVQLKFLKYILNVKTVHLSTLFMEEPGYSHFIWR